MSYDIFGIWEAKLKDIAKHEHIDFDFVYKHLKSEINELGEPGANYQEELEDCLNTLGLIIAVTGVKPDYHRMLNKLYEKDKKYKTEEIE